MTTDSLRTMGAVAGSAVLAAGFALAGAAQVQPALASETDGAAVAAAAEGVQAGASGATQARAVEGEFAFDQAALTPTADISAVFAKAATALCAGLPDYALTCACGAPIMVVGPDGATMQATVADLADGAEGSLVMGCSCATNAAGGGAIVNAQVSGASLASVLAAVIG